MGLGMGMGIIQWEWEGMGLKKIFPLISTCHLPQEVVHELYNARGVGLCSEHVSYAAFGSQFGIVRRFLLLAA